MDGVFSANATYLTWPTMCALAFWDTTLPTSADTEPQDPGTCYLQWTSNDTGLQDECVQGTAGRSESRQLTPIQAEAPIGNEDLQPVILVDRQTPAHPKPVLQLSIALIGASSAIVMQCHGPWSNTLTRPAAWQHCASQMYAT